jgi:hypothetical protein
MHACGFGCCVQYDGDYRLVSGSYDKTVKVGGGWQVAAHNNTRSYHRDINSCCLLGYTD